MRRRRSAVGVAVIVVGALAGCIRFGAATTHPVPLTPTQTIRSVLVGDVTGDGRDDVIASVETPSFATRSTQVMVSCGAGCTAPATLIDGWRPTTVADFDGDGADDVIVSSTSFYSGNARLYFGGPAAAGRPAGLAADDWIPLPAGWEYATGDLDGDGDVDLVQTVTFMTYYLDHRFLRNDGTGAFTDAGSVAGSGPLNAGGGGVLIVGDGERDHVYGRWGGQWTVGGPQSPSNVPADAFAAADVDGDGVDDLLLLTDDDRLTFSRGTGTGFAPFPEYQTIMVSQLGGWYVGELDRDEHADLWLFDRGTGPIYLGGSGDGGFPYEPAGTIPPGQVVFGDLDGDDVPEAIGLTADARGIEIHPNTATT